MEKLKNLYVISVLSAQKENKEGILFQNRKSKITGTFDHIEIHEELKTFKLNLHKSQGRLLISQKWDKSHHRKYLHNYNLMGCFLSYEKPQSLNRNIKWRQKMRL